MKFEKIKKYIIRDNLNLLEALKTINKNKIKTCFVVDKNNRLVGSITDGDIRRKLLNKSNLNQKIDNACNKKTKFILDKNSNDLLKIKKIFQENKIEIIPIINKEKIIKNLFFKDLILGKKKINKIKKNLSEIPVLVMAGGKGTRLDPITRVFPKPLVPIESQTVIEKIIDSFLKNNVKKFYFSLNYKAELIIAYFNNLKKKYVINYLIEKKPLGTAGSLEKVKTKIKSTFFLTNCDVIFNIDYSELLDFHKKHQNDLTVVVSKQNVIIPYGVCLTDKQNKLTKIIEKPKIKNLINTGLYVVNPGILKYIKPNQSLEMNDLILKLITFNKKIGIYKINKTKWYDIGQLKDYKKKINLLSA